MSLPAQKLPPENASASAQATPSGPQIRRLKKGEMLFNEGENSRAMYFVKRGMIRIFKKKGTSAIEIDTVRAGQVTGELAFLDGNPRSASGEALTDCELMEISGPVFQNVLANMPDWLKILLKTIVGRLRTASVRIRQLETASSAYDYSDKDGKMSLNYVYLAPHDVLKISTALLLTASRSQERSEKGVWVKMSTLQRYANQILNVPVAKLTTLLDVFQQTEILHPESRSSDESIPVLDVAFLEKFIHYLSDENLLEPAKRHDLSVKGFFVMGLIAKHLHKFPKDEGTGFAQVNLATISKAEIGPTGKEPFRPDEFQELVKLNYATQLKALSSTEMMTSVRVDYFQLHYRFQRVVNAIHSINEQKRKGAK